MTFALTFSAIRRHPVSFALAALVAMLTASLLGASAASAVGLWLLGAALAFELWYLAEPTLLRRLCGCRVASDAERQRVEAALGRTDLRLLVADTGDLAAARGLRCLVLARDLLDLFEDRALSGFLAQAAQPLQSENLAAFLLVWLGNLPLLAAWLVTRFLGQLARLLALAVGCSLVVPLVLWRDGFLCWAGRLFASAIVGLLGASLVLHGFAAAGVLLLIAWLVTPGLRAVLAWESRRVERSADQATIAAGYGSQLLEAVELLAVAAPRPTLRGVFRILSAPGVPIVDRALRIRKALEASAPMS